MRRERRGGWIEEGEEGRVDGGGRGGEGGWRRERRGGWMEEGEEGRVD